MPLYLVKLRREVEWESYYEAPNSGVAEDAAKLDARDGTIIDEQILVEEVQPATVMVD